MIGVLHFYFTSALQYLVNKAMWKLSKQLSNVQQQLF